MQSMGLVISFFIEPQMGFNVFYPLTPDCILSYSPYAPSGWNTFVELMQQVMQHKCATQGRCPLH